MDDANQGNIQLLKEMKSASAVELFIDRTAPNKMIPAEEIYEFLTTDENYPFAKLTQIKYKIESWATISGEAKNQILKMLQQD